MFAHPQSFDECSEYDLLTTVFLIPTEFGGRKGAGYSGYRGQFYWHINGVPWQDWDAHYWFKDEGIEPGNATKCKIQLSDHLKSYSKGNFPRGKQFGIREGATIVGVGIIEECRLPLVE